MVYVTFPWQMDGCKWVLLDRHLLTGVSHCQGRWRVVSGYLNGSPKHKAPPLIIQSVTDIGMFAGATGKDKSTTILLNA